MQRKKRGAVKNWKELSEVDVEDHVDENSLF